MIPFPAGFAGAFQPCRTLRVLSVLLVAAGCSAAPPAPKPRQPLTSAAPAPPAGPLAPAQTGTPLPTASAPLDENGKPMLFNDPPAAPDTPLCGREARERNAIGSQVQGARVASSGICASFACYDPLTATYIGADGYTHVCR